MERINVLLVEDEATLAGIVKDALETQEFKVAVASDGSEGLKEFFDLHPDILVADVMMPKMDGFEMVRRIRQTDKITPVIFLTAKSGVDDVVEGFERGANDYLKKPFAIQELIVRLRALLGRVKPEKKEVAANEYVFGGYRFFPSARTLTFIPYGETVKLSDRESEILRYLCQNQGSTVPTQNLLLDLWGDDDFFNARSLQVFITKLRHHLSKDSGIRIVNTRGAGYKLLC